VEVWRFSAATSLLCATALAALVCCVSPSIAAAKTCSEYRSQAEAQRAADTRDGDGDGIYCEALPCPCSTANAGEGSPTPPSGGHRSACKRPSSVEVLWFSARRYPHIRRHVLRALRRGWPRTLVLDRPGASARRNRLLRGIPTRPGFDRDEYPPAIARGVGPGLTRGVAPVGWLADVEYVPSRENRSQGAVLGHDLHPFCDGARFRYAFY
jgi:hypothetical protein